LSDLQHLFLYFKINCLLTRQPSYLAFVIAAGLVVITAKHFATFCKSLIMIISQTYAPHYW